MDRKKEIRRQLLGLRERLGRQEWLERTEAVFQNTVSHPWFQEAEHIYCYVDFRGEAGTAAIMERAWELGKAVAVPRTRGEEMGFFYIRSLEETAPGNFGVREPDPERCETADGREGLMILPGSAFDLKGYRIGYGKGYYDRYMEAHPGLRTMALAFDFQVLEEIPHEPHDRRARVIVTDRRVITTAKKEMQDR